MKCPQCELVHPASDLVCRRCEINLKTGEPASRMAERALVREAEKKAGKESAKTGKDAERAAGPAREKDRSSDTGAAEDKQARKKVHRGKEEADEHKPSFVIPSRKKKKGLASRLGIRPKGDLAEIACNQCAGVMLIEKQAPFSNAWPYALIGLGIMLFVIGIVISAYLLWILALASAGAGLFYRRVGKTRWKCQSCGVTVPRA